MPLPISVIIPTYCRPELTAQALLSVYRQTKTPNEVLLVDDASPEQSFADLQSYCHKVAAQFSPSPMHLEFHRLSRHLGMPGALRNIAMQHARNPWFAFLDSDDTWLPEKLAKQWNLAQETGIVVIHSRELWLRFGQPSKQAPQGFTPEQTKELLLPPFTGSAMPKVISQKKHKQLRSGTGLWPDALKKCIMGPSTLLLHKSVCRHIGYFDPKLQIAEDYEYFLRIIAKFPVAYCPEYLVAKRDYIQDSNAQAIPQLSHKYPWIEPFRLVALEKFLLSPRAAKLLSPWQRQSAIAELCRKIQICLAGAHKRYAQATDSQSIEQEIGKLQAQFDYWR